MPVCRLPEYGRNLATFASIPQLQQTGIHAVAVSAKFLARL
jgi:hypothetical protein